MTKLSESIYCLALTWPRQIGPSRLSLLRRYFTDFESAWQGSISDYVKAGLDQKNALALKQFKTSHQPDELLTQLEKFKIRFTTILDDNYPKLLKEISDPPPTLFYKGSLSSLNQLTIAIVGSRRASSYGLQATYKIAADLCVSGATIISGLAYGIDTKAHTSALDNNGLTAAVLAGGLDKIYPTSNTDLAEKIIKQQGCILSEFPPQTPCLKQNFPYRNRLIAGLSKIIIVAEAAIDSGALITAKLGLDYNRDIWAVPGNINNPLSVGPNQLIQQGAGLVTEAKDIYKSLNIEAPNTRLNINLTDRQTKLINELSIEPKNLPELVKILNWPIDEILAELTVLEVAGYVTNSEPGYYARAP